MKKSVVVVLFLFALLAFVLPAEAVYDTWAYKIEIIVNNPGAALSDYPVRVNIPAKTFIQALRMNSDLRDIRFSDGTNALPFWINISESMQRNINNMPIYVKLKTFSAGNNVIFMYFDKTKTKTDSPPKVDYTAGAAGDYCGDGGATTLAPYSSSTCGKNVFGLSGTSAVTGMFSYDCSDATANGWTVDNVAGSCIGISNKKWASKYKYGTSSNAFDFYSRVHYHNSNNMTFYFLTQNASALTAAQVTNIDYYCGYKLFIDGSPAATTTNQQYRMGNPILTIQKKTTNCGTNSTGWSTMSTYNNWHPYENSIQDFDIKVTSASIATTINGNLIGTYARGADTFTGGYVGFNRGTFIDSAEFSSNSTDGISPMWVINNYPGSTPVATFFGEADLAIQRLKPTVDASFTGQDVIETYPQTQVLEDYVDGNTLEKYIYSTFPLASLETQVFKYNLKVRNRGNVSDNFALTLKLTGDTSSWSVGYDYGSGITYNLPGTGGTPTSGTVTLGAGAQQVITIYVMPSNAALFEGGKGSDNLILDFSVAGQKDFSFDNVRFTGNLRGKSGCYWKWKMPITVSYNDTNTTGDLRSYQVLVNVSGVSQFSDALTSGADIMFTDSSGTKLPFYMKSFNRAAGSGSFWVNVPKVTSGTPGVSTIYIWWGNSNYTTTLSDAKKTFDLWEDWQKKDSTHFWNVGDMIGCPDGSLGSSGQGTPNCNSQLTADPFDLNAWVNVPTPADNYNWWSIKDKTGNLSGQAIMADKGASNTTSDPGPSVAGGDVRWKNYEFLYSFYDEYDNYNAGAGNPQFNPVYFQDAGNSWGMEFYAGGGNVFIFRPFGYGTDWTWTYQANAGAILGGTFPAKSQRYYVKTKLFQNPLDGKTHLKLHIAPTAPTDVDSDGNPFKEITPTGGFVSDPAFNISGGKVGLGGWNGGFSYDDLRVRKYTEPEPTCTAGAPATTTFQPVVSLSSPNLTSPLMNHRPVLISATVTPWAWTGNLTAVYADCYISGDCKTGENSSQPGTISLWGSVDANTPKGMGDQLMEAVAGDNNRSTINDSGWKTNGRYMFTAYDSNSDGRISCATTPGDCLAFGTSTLTTTPSLITMLGLTTLTDAQSLVKFVRGQYISAYPRSDTRNKCTSGNADTCQWKLGDVIHSNPLVVGIPNMLYNDTDYTTFMNNNNSRDLVAYFGSNEGIFHAARMATYDTVAQQYAADATATELWAFIPNAVLGSLGRTTDALHEYVVDLKSRAIDIKSGGTYKTVLMAGLRSGGQSFFAMDVTDPRSPRLMWEINSGQSSNSSAFLNVGKAWSAPALGRLCESSPCDGTNSSNRWVAIVGSGFSPKDLDNLSKTAYLSIIDLQTGAFIKQIQVSAKVGNITTDIAVVRDNNGYLQKIYFGDYYGVVWRIDLTTTGNVSSLLSKIALDSTYMIFQPSDYGTSDIRTTGAGPQRPVTSQPRIAYAGTNQFWIYFGSGVYNEYDAAYPYQRFYGLQDSATTYVDTSLVNMTLSTATNASKLSWFIELGHTDATDMQLTGTALASCVTACLNQSADNTAGYCNSVCNTTSASSKDRNERVINTPEIFGGFIFFGTYTPTNAPCANGIARFYALNYVTGGTVPGLMMNASTQSVRSLQISSGSGIPSSPLIFTGRSGAGQVVAAGLIDISTGQMVKVMLDPNKFTDVLNILLWRQVK